MFLNDNAVSLFIAFFCSLLYKFVVNRYFFYNCN